jgi:hypothetical protein
VLDKMPEPKKTDRRLLLAHLHERYRFELSRDKFILEYRRYPLPVLKQAETQLRSQLHRDDIRSLTRYFGAIVRSEMGVFRAAKTRRAHFEQRGNAAGIETERHANLRRSRLADPVAWLREAIEGLVSQWQPCEQQLLFGGVGAALGWMQQALRRIAVVHGDCAIADITNGVMNDCAQAHFGRLGQPGVDAIQALLQRELSAIAQPSKNPSCQAASTIATLWNTGRTKRPPAPNPLPI